MEVYLDNAATTRPLDSVCRIMETMLCRDWGNPSSMHKMGLKAEQAVRKAAQMIAGTLKADPKQILFTSGGTEANNLALIGTAFANRRRGNHIITTAFEHPSVYEPLFFLEENGFRITCLPVDKNGRIRMEELEEAIGEDTILVSVMHVNNEIGAAADIEEIAGQIKKKNPHTLFHADAIQSYGKYRIFPKRWGIDLLTASAHKIHGPKGAGFLYAGDGVRINPILFGGGQQRGMRSGTENVPGIAGFGVAAEAAYDNIEEKTERLYCLKELFAEQAGNLENVKVHGLDGIPVRETAPHLISVGFEGVPGEVLLHALEEKGIYVSAGSACSSNHPGISGSLKAIGTEKKWLTSTLRFSLSVFTTEEEIRYTIAALKELLPRLRRYSRH